MKKFKDFSVRNKLIVSHSLIFILTLFVAFFGIYGVTLSAGRQDRMKNISVVSTQAVGDIMYATADLQLVTTSIVTLPASQASRMPALEQTM